MEVITLLKANIRKKKGSFISIAILMSIIVAVMTSVFSVKDNYDNALTQAFEDDDCGAFITYIRSFRYTDELEKKVESCEEVEKVKDEEAIAIFQADAGQYYEGGWFMRPMMDKLEVFNENYEGFISEQEELKSGEIYIPLGAKERLKIDVGDTIYLETLPGRYEYVVKGFIQEPVSGSNTIGWKQVFVCEEDYNRIYNEGVELEDEEHDFLYKIVTVYQNEASKLSAAKFQRKVNLETNLVSLSYGSLNMEQSLRYTTLLPDMVIDVVMVFAIILLVIVLIVMSHSISTEIDIDYVALGVLKSQGFSKEKIRLVIILQYLLAQLIGIFAGFVIAMPIEDILSDNIVFITAILPYDGISVVKSFLFSALVLIISALLIINKTAKIAKISPVRAISGGKEEIYFDNRLQLPISKKALASSLSFRQFTSDKKRYIGTIFIVGLLTFAMITVNHVGTLFTKREALAGMGVSVYDFQLFYTGMPEDEEDYLKNAEEIVKENYEIKNKQREVHYYASLEGENLSCEIYEDVEEPLGIYEGRAPIYKNEIMITEMVADALDLKIGDEVSVAYREKKTDFVITALYQSTYDGGMSFAMNFKGADILGMYTEKAPVYYNFTEEVDVDNDEKFINMVHEIADTYGEYIGISWYDEEQEGMAMYNIIVNILKVVIYSFSLFFSFVVVRMVCTKFFVQERKDIGIYKALGFTSRKLRIQFAIRFLIVALIGAALGMLLSVLLSAKVLGLLLGLIGMVRINIDYTFMSMFLPTAVIGVGFFVFAFWSSRRIKSVEVRELIVE